MSETRTTKRTRKHKTATAATPKTSIVSSNNKTASKQSNKKDPATVTTAALSASRRHHQQQASSSPKGELLFELPADDLVLGELLCRPSKRNKSPYVGDVLLLPSSHDESNNNNNRREAIVHLPNLDMGGKCRPGALLLMKPARDRKGNLVGPHAVNPKYGTPKCEFIAQLLRVDESSSSSSSSSHLLSYDSKQGQERGQEEEEEEVTTPLYEPVWVGAHPSLGEKIAEQLIARNNSLLGPNFPAVASFQREVRNVGGMDMRADFVVQHVDKSLPRRVVEVKTVVDTDYAVGAVPDTNLVKCTYTSDAEPYVRTAIFPWGSGNQKGPNGEAVVSARAIKHVRELTKLAQGKQVKGEEKYDATILFVVIRGDAKQFRPNHEACPSFAKYLKEAEEAGVQVIAKQVCWGEGSEMGKCFEGDLLDVVWP